MKEIIARALLLFSNDYLSSVHTCLCALPASGDLCHPDDTPERLFQK